jgi:hypothetical protein
MLQMDDLETAKSGAQVPFRIGVNCTEVKHRVHGAQVPKKVITFSKQFV